MKKIRMLLAVVLLSVSLTACSSDDTIRMTTVNASMAGNVSTNENNMVSSGDKYAEVMKIINNATLQYPASNNEFEYNVYDTYIQITKYIGSIKNTDIIFPSEIDNLPVLVVGGTVNKYGSYIPVLDWLVSYGYQNGQSNSQREVANSVTLSEGIAIIEKGAFKDIIFTDKLVLPQSLLEIKHKAFMNASFANLILPESLINIEAYAFFSAKGYYSDRVNLNYSPNKGVEDNLKQLDVIIPKSVKQIGDCCFSDGSSDGHCIYGFGNVTILNPDLQIGNKALGKFTNGTIFGYAGSTAVKYATDNHINFQLLG